MLLNASCRLSLLIRSVRTTCRQVVNGIKYFLTLEVAETSCERPLPPFTLCFVASDTPRLLYAVELLHQPHRANTELLSLRKVSAPRWWHVYSCGLSRGVGRTVAVTL